MSENTIPVPQKTADQADAPVAHPAENQRNEKQTGAHDPHNPIGGKNMEKLEETVNEKPGQDSDSDSIDQFVKNLSNSDDADEEDGNLQPGKCEATITNVYNELRLPRKYDMVHIDFVLQTPPHAGVKISKEYHLTTKKARNFMIRELDRLGIEFKKREDIAAACEKLIGKRVKLSVQYPPNGNKAVYITGDASAPEEMLDPDALWDGLEAE